ncbi:MAG: hypothetical protein OHK0023_02000 [Anaerolineae bacterium]
MADPNLIYLLYLVGLWSSVFGLYIPGTGAAEGIAAISMIGALIALAVNPATNWLAAVLLGAGVVGFMLLPIYQQRWARFALVGLVAQVVGGLLLFGMGAVSPVLVGLTAAISFGMYQLVLLPFHRKQTSLPVIDDEKAILNASGYVVKALDPVGTVNIQGELWTAYSSEPLSEGTYVAVVAKEGLRLFVEPTKHKHRPAGRL